MFTFILFVCFIPRRYQQEVLPVPERNETLVVLVPAGAPPCALLSTIQDVLNVRARLVELAYSSSHSKRQQKGGNQGAEEEPNLRDAEG